MTDAPFQSATETRVLTFMAKWTISHTIHLLCRCRREKDASHGYGAFLPENAWYCLRPMEWPELPSMAGLGQVAGLNQAAAGGCSVTIPGQLVVVIVLTPSTTRSCLASTHMREASLSPQQQPAN